MSSLIDFEQVYTKPPSYIKEINKSAEKIYLLYKKLNTAASDIKKDSLEPEIEDDNISSVDLTGNPLNIDLNADMSLLPLEEHIWSPQENNHYPLPLNIARKIINKCNRDRGQDINAYIYCVCDGTDRKCTLALGAIQTDNCLDRIQICNEGCFYQDDLINLEKIRQEHQNNRSVLNRQVNSLITATYTVFGNNLRNYKISTTLPYSSCIMYNVSWNTYQYEVPEYVQSAEMTLQTLIGHKESHLHLLWNHLAILQIYINILLRQSADLDEIILTDNPKSYIDISENIWSLLEEMQSIRKIISRQKIKDSFDINNLRQEDLIDKLWNILISCNNVGDLKNCFHTLFEELARKESFKPLISDDNKTSIAAIINEISSGKLAVPTLSLPQSLQYLIELGIEKLKNDYFYILNHFDCVNYEKLGSYWSKVVGQYTDKSDNIKCAPNSRLTKQDFDKVTSRRTRLTAQSTSLIEASEKLTKLNCLLKMHVACGFVVLAEKVRLSTQESFNALIESVAEYILQTETTICSKNYSDCMLEEITVRLQSNDVKFLHSKDPTSWNVKLVSTNDRSIVTTVQHHSLKPLFPPCIYNKYDAPVSNDAGHNIYYVTKMIQFTEKI